MYLPIYVIICVFFEKKLLHVRNIYILFFFVCTFREIVLLSRENRRYIYLRCVELNVSFKIVDFRHFLFRGAVQSRAKSFSPNGPLLDRFVIPRQDRFLLLSARFVNSAFHRVYSCNSSSSSRSNAHMCIFFLFI